MNKEDEHLFTPRNRTKSMTASKRKFWCSRCDANKVGQHGKCSVCGNIENKRKIR